MSISINNSNHKITEKQENLKKTPSFAYNFAKNPTMYEKYLTYSDMRVLDTIICYDNKHGTVFAGQKIIAEQAGIHLATCNKIVSKLTRLNFIEKESRGFKKSCQYYLSPMFKDKSIRARLSKYFPSLRWVPIVTLMLTSLLSKPKELQIENALPIRERNIYIYPYPTVIDSYTVKNSPTYGTVFKKNFQKENKNGIMLSSLQKKDILEQIANKNYENIVPSYIKNLKQLNLTKWGQIRLSIFPEQAIKFANATLMKTPNISCKFSFMIKLCIDYCKKNNIQPDWKWQNKLFELLQKPDNAPMFLQQFETPKQQTIENNYTSCIELEHDICAQKELLAKYLKMSKEERGNLYNESLKKLNKLEKQLVEFQKFKTRGLT